MKRLVLCGGHLSPALALIEHLKDNRNLEIIFFGRRHATEGSKNLSAEYKEITNYRINFVGITTGRLQRKFTSHTMLSLLKIPIGFIQSFYYLLKYRPNLVVSFGSYHSTPVVIAAWLLRIDAIGHEQAIIPGLATKINALFVKKIFLTWRETLKYFDPKKAEVIGNLVREAIFKKTPKDLKIKKFIGDKRIIFITGGNQGSHFINRITFNVLPKLTGYGVIHQAGGTNFQGDWDKARKIKKPNYLAVSYLGSENIGSILNNCDLVIGRSGANTVWELATLAKVAIFIPLPHSASGEQQENARQMQEAGSAIIISQEDASVTKIKESIDTIFNSFNEYQKNARSFSKKLEKDGVAKISNYILENLHAQNS